MVLRRVVGLVRLGCRCRLLEVMLGCLLTMNGGVRSARGSLMPFVGDVVQLRTLGVHVWLLITMLLLLLVVVVVLRLLLLTIDLSVLLRRRRGLAETRCERRVLLVMRRLRLTPLLGRVSLSREGGVDGVA